MTRPKIRLDATETPVALFNLASLLAQAACAIAFLVAVFSHAFGWGLVDISLTIAGWGFAVCCCLAAVWAIFYLVLGIEIESPTAYRYIKR